MNNRIQEVIKESISLKQAILSDKTMLDNIEKIVDICITCFQKGNKVLFCGNGGSAADAQHLAAEFSGRFYFDREPLFAEALHVNTSYLTAVGNDYGYEFVFSRLLKGIGREGDVLIGISTSGNSTNIINAFEVANEKEITAIAFTGKGGGKMKEKSNISIEIPSNDTPRIQECHIMIGHIICELVEHNLFKR